MWHYVLNVYCRALKTEVRPNIVYACLGRFVVIGLRNSRIKYHLNANKNK